MLHPAKKRGPFTKRAAVLLSIATATVAAVVTSPAGATPTAAAPPAPPPPRCAGPAVRPSATRHCSAPPSRSRWTTTGPRAARSPWR